MDKFLFAFCVLIYIAVIVMLIIKTKESMLDTPTIPNRLYAAACGVIYIAIFIFLTSTIRDGTTIAFRDMNGKTFSLGALISYAFVWFVFYVLYGSILTVLLFIPHSVVVLILFMKDPSMTWRKLPPWLETNMWPAMYAVGAALAYNLLLYAFGLSNIFIPVFRL